MRNAGLKEAQTGIKIAGRNINNLRYAHDITLMAESEEELKSLLMKVKEESEKVGLKLNILQARLQQYVNRELPDVQADFRKGRGTRDQIANIWGIMEKAREFQKNIYFWCFIDYAKAFDCVDHNKLWKILKEMGVPHHLTSLLRNLYASQETTELDMEQQTGSK